MMLRKFALLWICAGLLLCFGCSKAPTPPPPLALDQLPAELAKAFQKAAPETKDLVAQINSSVEKKEFAQAFDLVRSLCSAPDATDAQRSLAARAMLSIHAALESAGAQGDEKAAAALEQYRRTK